jgi:hypothetical protein
MAEQIKKTLTLITREELLKYLNTNNETLDALLKQGLPQLHDDAFVLEFIELWASGRNVGITIGQNTPKPEPQTDPAP